MLTYFQSLDIIFAWVFGLNNSTFLVSIHYLINTEFTKNQHSLIEKRYKMSVVISNVIYSLLCAKLSESKF